MAGPPVDLSFRGITSAADAKTEKPRKGRLPVKKTPERKYLSCSLRLNNNLISELSDLQATVAHFLAEPSRLAWLDLSFNSIPHIHPVLCEFQELRVLYLHGNRLCELAEVDLLTTLPHLHTLTLHGNAIEYDQHYRRRVVTVLPQLKKLDFSVVTRQERAMAQIWHRHGNRCKAAQRDLHRVAD